MPLPFHRLTLARALFIRNFHTTKDVRLHFGYAQIRPQRFRYTLFEDRLARREPLSIYLTESLILDSPN